MMGGAVYIRDKKELYVFSGWKRTTVDYIFRDAKLLEILEKLEH